jgi:hypothetical protein
MGFKIDQKPELLLFKSEDALYFKLKNNLPEKKRFNLSQAFNRTSLILHAFNTKNDTIFLPCMEARINQKYFLTSEYYIVELGPGQEINQLIDPLGCRNSFFKDFNYKTLLRDLNEDTLYVFLEYMEKNKELFDSSMNVYLDRITSDTVMIF